MMPITEGAARRVRAARLMAALLLLLALGAAPARGDDDGDDGGGAGAGAAGAGGAAGGGPGGDGAGVSAADGRGGLGPDPGRIPMPPAWERSLRRLFGAAPPPRPPAARAELVAAGLGPAQRAALRRQGFTVVAERAVPGLARLRGPAGLAAPAALARLRAVAPGAVADRNHTYRLAAEPDGAPRAPAAAAAAATPPAACGPEGPLVALVDTGVDARHPELSGRVLRQEVLRGQGRRPARTAHGTAVALRLATAAPAARLVVLDAFHLGPNGEAADAYDLAAALARAAAIGAEIVNVSVVGPANAVVDRLGAEAAAKGVVFVAAAGNDGPRAAPLHPAAYAWAVAVSAVDSEGRPWARSAAGRHIAFAAHGVQVRLQPGAAAPPRAWSGTSFAAPLVAAALAGAPGQGAARIEHLVGRARDAGAPGRDPVYGWGVVDPPACAAAG